MPASYTHQQFGNQVLNKLENTTIKKIINDNLNLYNIGLQGPDILFFYQPLKKNPVNTLGNQLHQDIARAFFENAMKLLKEQPNEKSLAYILGFINHFILDSECHGYIDKTMINREIGHFEIEHDLDQRFMILNHESFNYSTPKHYQINLENAKIIAPFFNLAPATILASLKSFKRFNHLFACRSVLKRSLILTGMKIVNAKSYCGMVMTAKPEKRIEENIDILVNLFNQSINIATKEIIEYYYSYQNNTAISKRFNYNYE